MNATHRQPRHEDYLEHMLDAKQMRGMRNRMAHGYFEIDVDIVRDTVQGSLPELARQITAVGA